MSTSSSPMKPSGDGGSSASSGISIDKATREELVEFIKKQAIHIKKVETVYSRLKKENAEITSKYSQLEEESNHQKQMAQTMIKSLEEELNNSRDKQHSMSSHIEESLMETFQQEKQIFQEERKRLQDQVNHCKQLIDTQQQDLESINDQQKQERLKYTTIIDNLNLELNHLKQERDELQQQQQQQQQQKDQQKEQLQQPKEQQLDQTDSSPILDKYENEFKDEIEKEEQQEEEEQQHQKQRKQQQQQQQIEIIKENEMKENQLSLQLDEMSKQFEDRYKTYLEERDSTIEFLSKQKKEIEELLADHNQEMAELRNEIKTKQEEALTYQNTISSLQNQITELNNRPPPPPQPQPTAAQDDQIIKLEEKVNKLKNLLLGAQKHVSEQKKQILDKTNEITILNQTIKSLETSRDENESMETEYHEMKNNVDYYLQRIRLLEDQLSSTTLSMKTLQDDYNQYKIKAAYALGQQEQKEEQEKEKESDHDEHEDVGKENQELIHQLEEENKQYIQTIDQLHLEIDTLKQNIVASENNLHSIQEQLDILHMENSKYENNIKSLKDQLEYSHQQLQTKQHHQNQVQIIDNNKNNNEDIDYENELKLKEEKIIDLQSQLNFFKRNNNSIMREKERLIEQQRETIKNLQDSINQQPNNNNNSSNTLNINESNNQIVEENINNDNNSDDKDQDENTTTTTTFSIEHLLPTSTILPKDSQTPIELPDTIPLEVEKILDHYARTQANRDEDIRRMTTQINEYKYLISESEKMEKKHLEQERLLKEEIRNLERKTKREGSSMEYLKNIIVKFIEKEDESLIPVISNLMQFSPEELAKTTEAVRLKKSSIWNVTSYFGR